MQSLRLLVILALALGMSAWSAKAAEPVLIARVVTKLPRTEAEVIAAHNAAKNDACQEVKPGEALEIPGFSQRVNYAVVQGEGSHRSRVAVPFDTARQSVLSLGLGMTADDREQLPAISGSTIQERVDGNYITVQARVLRPASGGAPYLYYRPQAMVGNYANAQKTQDFADLMRSSIHDMRSLGLFVEPGTPVTAEQLRTMVIVHRSEVIDEVVPGDLKTKPVYELLFIRAREVPADGGTTQLALHGFATSDNRTRLHYFPAYQVPPNVQACHIESVIVITEFGWTGIAPTARATRRADYRSRAEFELSQLDRFVADQNLPGDALDHPTLVLDAIIDGKIEPVKKPASPN